MSNSESAIRQLVARFDDAVNRRDAEEFSSLWATDGVWEIGEPRPLRVEGASTIIETWKMMLSGTQWLFRGSFEGVLNIDGDRAAGRWPCVEQGVFADGASYDNRAYYDDEYVFVDGEWKFLSRRYVYLWISDGVLSGEAQQPI